MYGTHESWVRQVVVTERELRIGRELIENLVDPFRSDQIRLYEVIERKATGETIKVVQFRPQRIEYEDELVRVVEESLKRIQVR
jgi:hypothetical protein